MTTPSKYVAEERDWEKKAWLYEKYWGELLTQKEMAEDQGVSRGAIRQELESHGIPSRPNGWSRDGSKPPWTGFYEDERTPGDGYQSNAGYDEDKDPDTDYEQGLWLSPKS